VGSVYRLPRSNIEHVNVFIEEMKQLVTLLKKKRHVFLAGDFNLDLLKFDHNPCCTNFLESVIAHGYILKITLPTRLTQRHGTLIDIFHKVTENFMNCTNGILLSGISDH